MPLNPVYYHDYFNEGEDKLKFAFNIIDDLISDLPDYENFYIHEHLKKFDHEKRDKIFSISSTIISIMIEEGIICIPQNMSTMHKMTSLGREMKKEGGYFKYAELVANKDLKSNISSITNNIYGNNESLNNAVGNNISITSYNKSFLNENQKQELKNIGLNNDEVEQLNSIVSSDHKDSSERTKKIFAWVSSVTASMVSRGIYDHIPQVTEFISQLL